MNGNLLIDATVVREAFSRLLAQDSWEEPYVRAARQAFDRILTLAATATGHSPSPPKDSAGGAGSP